jgi:hypothetical protein
MTKYVNYLDGRTYEATTIEELVGLMCVMTSAGQVDEKTWLEEAASRASAAVGANVRSSSSKDFIDDMIEHGIIAIESDKVGGTK